MKLSEEYVFIRIHTDPKFDWPIFRQKIFRILQHAALFPGSSAGHPGSQAKRASPSRIGMLEDEKARVNGLLVPFR